MRARGVAFAFALAACSDPGGGATVDAPPPSDMQTFPTSIFSLRERIETRTPPPFAVVSSTPTWTPSTLRP